MSERPSRLSRWWASLRRLRGPLLIVAGVGTVLGGLAGYFNAWRALAPTATGVPAPQVAADRSTAEAEPLSILVLPFANQTGKPALAHLADGLTTAVTGDLSRIRGAVVVPAVTAASLATRSLPLVQLGAQARVRYVLQGAVTAHGEQLRIHAQLADTRSGSQVWSHVFDGQLTDVFALQDSVTARIRNSVAPQMVIRAARDAEMRRQTPQASDLMLRVRAFELQEQSPTSLKAIEALCRQVLGLEPGHLEAQASLSRALGLQASNFFSELGLDRERRVAMRTESAALAQAVLRADPDEVRMHMRLAFYAWVDGNIEVAKSRFSEALRLDPLNATTYNDIGVMYRDLGQPGPAREHLEKALALPRSFGPHRTRNNLSTVAMQEGRHDEAVTLARLAVEGAPENVEFRVQLTLAHALQGNEAAARQSAQEVLRLAPAYRLRRPPPKMPPPFDWYRAYFASKLEPAARLAGLPVEE